MRVSGYVSWGEEIESPDLLGCVSVGAPGSKDMCLGETEGVQLTWVLMGRTHPADDPLPILRPTGTPSLVAPFPLGSLWG